MKPDGAIVTITYDAGDRDVADGDALVTTTGRLYAIVGLREVASAVSPRRLRLRCVVMGKVAAPSGVVVHPLHWYARQRRPRS